MRKQVSWEVLLEIIGRFPEGASLEEILVGLDPATPRRTLQRWLASLIKSHRLATIGRARARRYKLFHVTEQEELRSLKLISIPISETGILIQEKVSQPLHARQPVTYNTDYYP